MCRTSNRRIAKKLFLESFSYPCRKFLKLSRYFIHLLGGFSHLSSDALSIKDILFKFSGITLGIFR